MTNTKRHSLSDQAAQQIRNRAGRAIALNRRPGFHFPGYFLGLTWPHIGKNDIVEEMVPGPHCVNSRGEIDFVALGVMIDGGLATSARLPIPLGARMATVNMSAQFTGASARGKLRMSTEFQGFTVGKAIPQGLSKGVLYADEVPLCHASAAFVLLPPPPHAKLAPLPWQDEPRPDPAPLAPGEMDSGELAILAACDEALARTQVQHTFPEYFWDVLPKTLDDGARCQVRLGPHHGNRVRHVQGGILFGLAAATACAAVPRHPMLCSIASWYISPGQGDTLAASSRVVHAGRSFAVARTEIKTAEGALVLEAMTNHASRR